MWSRYTQFLVVLLLVYVENVESAIRYVLPADDDDDDECQYDDNTDDEYDFFVRFFEIKTRTPNTTIQT